MSQSGMTELYKPKIYFSTSNCWYSTRTVKFAWRQIWCPPVRHRPGAKKGHRVVILGGTPVTKCTVSQCGIPVHCNVLGAVVVKMYSQPVWNTGILYCFGCSCCQNVQSASVVYQYTVLLSTAVGKSMKSVQFKRRHTHIVCALTSWFTQTMYRLQPMHHALSSRQKALRLLENLDSLISWRHGCQYVGPEYMEEWNLPSIHAIAIAAVCMGACIMRMLRDLAISARGKWTFINITFKFIWGCSILSAASHQLLPTFNFGKTLYSVRLHI
jgi:hypothetical protein